MIEKFIITASRRTDILGIPAYLEWFTDKLARGGCYVRNPRNGRPYYVSLKPEHVHGFVFWTKNPGLVMGRMAEIDAIGRPFAFFLTITGYGPLLEPGAPTTDRMLEMAKDLMRRYGPDRVWWRYDPVVVTERFDELWHVENFTRLAEALRGTPRCAMSWVLTEASYTHVGRRLSDTLAATGDRLVSWPLARMGAFIARLGEIASAHGIRPEICAQPDLALAAGIPPGSCMNLVLLRKIMPDLPRLPVKATRLNCLCHESRDIGSFDTCLMDCKYCSATRRRGPEGSYPLRIDPNSLWLWPEPLNLPILPG